MWGSTKANTADECTWANTPFNGGYSSYNDEYFTTHKSEWLDDNENLKPEFDTATQIMGSDWRMPTQSEFQELLDNTTKEWTQVNGINGYKFTSKKEGYQNNSIFIPATGSYHNGLVKGVDTYGIVRSSSLCTSDPEVAYTLYFDSDSCYMDDGQHYIGYSVRGVCE